MPKTLPRFVFPLLVVLTVGLAASTVYFYRQFNVAQADPQKIAQAEAQELATEVGKLIVLPTDELPTVATVSDPEQLKTQPFFAGAKQGDKVLIYTNAKKAILYDPVAKKIVTVAPINIGAAQTPTPTTTTPARSTN